MQFHIIYLPTGRKETNKDGTLLTITASSERGAKCKITKAGRYFNWDLYTVIGAN